MKIRLKPSLPILLMSVLLLSVGSLGACGESDRTEDFCTMACACQSTAEEEALCTSSCLGAFSEEPGGVSPISDECYACVNNTPCQVIETSCDIACADLGNRNDQTSEPDPGESN